MNSFAVNSILGKLNAESARIIKSFLADSITEEEFKKQMAWSPINVTTNNTEVLSLQQKFYDALVEAEVITPSEDARKQIVEEGKAIPISIEAALKCKKGEITWKELSDICSKQVLPLARQEAENVH